VGINGFTGTVARAIRCSLMIASAAPYDRNASAESARTGGLRFMPTTDRERTHNTMTDAQAWVDAICTVTGWDWRKIHEC
jgi:hypothetical protein